MNHSQGLYQSHLEHDACGIGFVVHIKGRKEHKIVKDGLDLLKNLTHRGATGYDPKLGDGAGILTQIPDQFFRAEMARNNIFLPPQGEYACGVIFLPQDKALQAQCQTLIEKIVQEEKQTLIAWRDLPVHNEDIAKSAKLVEPTIKHLFIGKGSKVKTQIDFERKCFVIRKRIEHAVYQLNLNDSAQFYIPSFSSKIIVYKGMLLAKEVREYYPDLQDTRFTSCLALVHQRFSTNTFPSWDLAHPFRVIAHNGEINTLRGNINWMKAREALLQSKFLKKDLQRIFPIIREGQSDSAALDNALELLILGGYSLPHAVMMLIPEAWHGNALMSDERKNFYEYHALLTEPWDGPAAVAFTDGETIGATLDRNGLRPARYLVTDDDYVMMASEMGVLTFPEERIIKKWRLEPGKMLLIDTIQGRIIDDEEIKQTLSRDKPYADLLKASKTLLSDLPEGEITCSSVNLLDLQQAFAYTQEDIKFILMPMVETAEEATGSMGNDSALSVLSDRPKILYHYFRQLFAQITNPPIDPIRESLVMSLMSFLCPQPNLLEIDPKIPSRRLVAEQPILTLSELANIQSIRKGFHTKTLSITYDVQQGESFMQTAMAQLCISAISAVEEGYDILILSDRDISEQRIAIPALLACSGVHQTLLKKGMRTKTGLIIDTGSAREVHHFALLAGYGAQAICPWLVFQILMNLQERRVYESHKNFVKAINKGLLKVMSKMGVSTYQSYCGGQVFEAIGLNHDFIEQYFSGTSSQIGGIGLLEIAKEAHLIHQKAFANDDPILVKDLDAGGEYAYRIRGENHLWTPLSIAKLQYATRTNEMASYQEYAKLINDQNAGNITLRSMFEINQLDRPISLDEVESAKEIVKRFSTGAMSLGSISTEAHTTLAIAMNRIGGKSNTGEGGEDPRRFVPVQEDIKLSQALGHQLIESDVELKKGDSLRSKIKQVASGRFGVTAEYLTNADQIQIKISQGAKPGEGGQLPGHKVSAYIAELRYSVPGVGLISPPPHHDIYSIEDLAQLIYDLKNANPSADISVKLVSETGVGTVAAGVAKAKADHIVIAGHDGGTGASPISSIKHAGTPWELGLAETQQTLVMNKLRSRVIVQVDGQMKTGRDVVIGALLGADEFGFATAPLVAEGCIMMRKCHLNTCPVGIATQDPVLRKRFTGKPEYVVNYFFFVAEEVRQLMASMGIRRFQDLIGKSELLNIKAGIEHWKAKGLDFSKIFQQPITDTARHHQENQNHELENILDRQFIQLSQNAIESEIPVEINLSIRNINRTVGTLLSHEVTKKYGRQGLKEHTIKIVLKGTAGQSFSAFLTYGITIKLIGEGNDYVGKGLCGGIVIITPSADFRGLASANIIAGNTILYGATSGECYLNGVVGERFCVRNSGAVAVVEGVGNHGCEYMTGGTVVVLGKTGVNFAAGMSGGVAYVYDNDGSFAECCNLNMVKLESLILHENWRTSMINHKQLSDEKILRDLIDKHILYTNSQRAREIKENWAIAKTKFVKVMPLEYSRALTELAKTGS